MKQQKFPLTVREQGVSAKIRKISQTKKGHEYTFFMVDYVLLGKRKQEWYADLEAAKTAATDACKKIAAGEQQVLTLKNDDRLAYVRATDALAKTGVPIDVACREYAEAVNILGSIGSLTEAARLFVKTHAVQIPRVPISKAIEEMILQAQRDGKSEDRIHQLESYLNRFKAAFNCNVTDVTTKQVTDFIIGLNVKERTKKNCRDVLKAFFGWCIGRGYLAEENDPIERVEKYSSQREEEVEIFTPEELSKLIAAADNRFLPYIVIQAFAGVRGREIQKLDWSAIDLEDCCIRISRKIAKTGVSRLVPIKPNLKAWLQPLAQKSGPVCEFKNIYNQLADLATTAGIEWKKNALRHSYISYRVAECADIARVAEESGNSPSIIRSNYLNCRKPWEAAQWFGIMPGDAPDKVQMPTPEEARQIVAKAVVALPAPMQVAA